MKVNPALRIHDLLQLAINNTASVPQMAVWAKVFNVDQLKGRNQKLAIARGIDLLYRQLDRMVTQLRDRGFGEETYQPIVFSMEQNISVELLAHAWPDFRQRLQSSLYPLMIINNALDDEEKLIDKADLESLRGELDRLEETLAKGEIAAELQAFVKRQLEIIRQAIRDYPVRGVSAFYDAAFEGASEAWANEELVNQHKDDEAVKILTNVWTKVKQVTVAAFKVGTFLTASQRIYQLAESSSHIFKHFK